VFDGRETQLLIEGQRRCVALHGLRLDDDDSTVSEPVERLAQ
jgi:hypothetical protein